MTNSFCNGSAPFRRLVDHGGRDRSLHQHDLAGTYAIQQSFRPTHSISSTKAQENYDTFLDPRISRQIPLGMISTVNGHLSSMSPGREGRITVAQRDHDPLSLSSIQSASPELSYSAIMEVMLQPEQKTHSSSLSTIAPCWAQDFTQFSGSFLNGGIQASGFSVPLHQPQLPIEFAQQRISTHPRQFTYNTLHAPNAFNMMSNEADFDAEMDRWMSTHGDIQLMGVDATLDGLAEELREFPEHNSDKVDFDSLSDTDKPPQQSVSSDVKYNHQTEISEAARQILHSVKHEESEKWQNSQFLQLMKDFRDGHKDVINNEIRISSCSRLKAQGKERTTAVI